MGTRALLVAVAVAVVVALAPVGLSPTSTAAAWPPVKVDLAIGPQGTIFRAEVWVRNEGNFDIDVLNIRSRLPKGAKYVDSWSGSGPGFDAGVFDGNDVGWIAVGMKSGDRRGPFVSVFDASTLNPASQPFVLAWVSWTGEVPGTAVSRAVSIQTPLLALEVGVGTPPAPGWKWAVAEVATGTEEVIEGPSAHDYSWMFSVIRGSMELSTADGQKVFSSGEGVFIPARQQHTHRYLPQSRVLAFQLRPADDPPGSLHRGRTLFVSDTPLGVRAGVNYQLRVRESSLSPGEQILESVTAGPNFGYVVEGTLTVHLGESVTSTDAGKVFTLPLNVRHVESNEGSAPLRFLLVDVRGTAAAAVEALRRGGNVILLPHAETDRSIAPPEQRVPDASPLDLRNCEVQAKLTERGRATSRAIGASLRTLGIPVGQVLSDGYCRTFDTARLAFGDVELSEVLLPPEYAPIPGAPVPPTYPQRIEALKRLLSTPPPAGVNTVLVTHRPNIRELGLEVPQRELHAFIFRPDGQGSFTFLARVLPNEWTAFP